MDAGFLNVVEIGQYFMSKDTEEFSQFTNAVACGEYTFPRDEETSEPTGWIRGNTQMGPVLEVATCCLRGKYGVEIIIMYERRQFSLLSEQETLEVQFKEYALKLDASDFACRSKAKAKLQRREPAGSFTRTIPIGRKNLDRC